jgi:leader peptidase (prepilin peptidase) / N-methyltransferase
VLVCAGAALFGSCAGGLVNRLAGHFPWPEDVPLRTVLARSSPPAVRRPLLEVTTAVLAVLVVLGWGVSWQLPAFLLLAVAGVLLTVIDLQHRLLPDRIVLPSIAAAVVLLLVATLPAQEWAHVLRACGAAAVLFSVFLAMALIAPSGMGWGDVKLAPLVGLYLGWIGWEAVVVGAAAGFVVQAAVALVLLAGRRIGLRGELPFGPAMLVGAAVAIGWSDALLG